jgi:hypothetical protein
MDLSLGPSPVKDLRDIKYESFSTRFLGHVLLIYHKFIKIKTRYGKSENVGTLIQTVKRAVQIRLDALS